ncbi:hypothetical protein [Actinoplanes derwentensis]|uniref:hypothetical protein n=1 Tax=Actinoplanes derwentensis TaxID=113562 RepID=UPI0012FD1915|nr:hypothetical protein [Actinoplanes derwentensis]GID83869.1 hypothetical protein Ade03nite_27930 [Actinoplanes derwentensis]
MTCGVAALLRPGGPVRVPLRDCCVAALLGADGVTTTSTCLATSATRSPVPADLSVAAELSAPAELSSAAGLSFSADVGAGLSSPVGVAASVDVDAPVGVDAGLEDPLGQVLASRVPVGEVSR